MIEVDTKKDTWHFLKKLHFPLIFLCDTFACKDLTDFEYEVHPKTGNGSYVNLQETCLVGKTCEITSNKLTSGGF